MRSLVATIMLVGCAAMATAQVAREGKQVRDDCRLTWDIPKTNTNGTPLTDLKEFHLFVSTTKGKYDRSKPIKIPYPTNEYSCAKARILTDGQYYATIVAVDQAGNASKRSVDTPFYRDTTVPKPTGTMGVVGFERIPQARDIHMPDIDLEGDRDFPGTLERDE